MNEPANDRLQEADTCCYLWGLYGGIVNMLKSCGKARLNHGMDFDLFQGSRKRGI